jgi:hypothetical protein
MLALNHSCVDHPLNCRGECLLVRVKLACGSTKANGQVWPLRTFEMSPFGFQYRGRSRTSIVTMKPFG